MSRITSSNPFDPPADPGEQPREHPGLQDTPLDAKQAVRNARRYAIPVMSIGWLLLWIEFYFQFSHRMTFIPALLLSGFAALGYASMGLGIWLGCAAIVGAMRE